MGLVIYSLQMLRVFCSPRLHCGWRCYSSFLSGPSWSIRSLVPDNEEIDIKESDIKQCCVLSKLSGDVSEQTVDDVKQIIRCSSKISKVDVSADKFMLTPMEKETGKIFGMIS